MPVTASPRPYTGATLLSSENGFSQQIADAFTKDWIPAFAGMTTPPSYPRGHPGICMPRNYAQASISSSPLLAAGYQHAANPDDDLRCEDPHLLNPVADDDPNLLFFDVEGRALPAPEVTDDWERKRGEYSISPQKRAREPMVRPSRPLPDCPYFFYRKGRRIRYPYVAWRKACREAGLSDKIPHDFRRTAVRNMVRAGIPERIAMQIAGHETRAIFDRYHIVSDGDLQEVAKRLDTAFLSQTMTTPNLTEAESPLTH